MDTAAFRTAVLAELGEDLGRSDLPLAEIQAFVQRVLALCREHPTDVPEASLKPLIADFPGLAPALSAAVRNAERAKTSEEIAELRKKLKET